MKLQTRWEGGGGETWMQRVSRLEEKDGWLDEGGRSEGGKQRDGG